MLPTLPPNMSRWLAFAAVEGGSALLAAGAALSEATVQGAGSDVSLELIRLFAGVLATGGIVWKAMDIWAQRQASERAEERERWEALQTELTTLRNREEQRHQEDVAYYRQLLAEERERAASCEARLPAEQRTNPHQTPHD